MNAVKPNCCESTNAFRVSEESLRLQRELCPSGYFSEGGREFFGEASLGI